MTPRLVLFARYPSAGVAKTRLIPALGAKGAADIHRRLAEQSLAVLQSSKLPVELHFTGSEESAFRDWLGEGFKAVLQNDGDLTSALDFEHEYSLTGLGFVRLPEASQGKDRYENYRECAEL